MNSLPKDIMGRAHTFDVECMGHGCRTAAGKMGKKVMRRKVAILKSYKKKIFRSMISRRLMRRPLSCLVEGGLPFLLV